MNLKKKDLYSDEFKNTTTRGDHEYLSFYPELSLLEELDLLFNRVIEGYGKKHFGIYRMCDAEYMYCVGRKTPPQLSLVRKLKYRLKTQLIKWGLIVQKTGHENKVNKEFWFGENYSLAEKKIQKKKYIKDLKMIADEGYLSPHFVYSKTHFAEEYIMPMIQYFKKEGITLGKNNYFPFYFVYYITSVERYRRILFEGKNVLIVTSFNERNKQQNFTENLVKEKVKNVYFYNISHDKSMLEIIDEKKLPEKVDLVLIGAGIGSANIINQMKHLNALCIDAGHALDSISRPQLRVERIFLLPDEAMQ